MASGSKGAKGSTAGRKRGLERYKLIHAYERNKARRITRHAKTIHPHERLTSIKHPMLSQRRIIDTNKRRDRPPISGGLVIATKSDPDKRRITMRPVTNACADYIARSQPGGAIIHRLPGDVAHVYCR